MIGTTFEWYVRHNIPLDFAHLAERCKQFNNENITPELFKEKLIERLSSADIKQVKEDVLLFVRNPKELDIWSNDYFVQLAGDDENEIILYLCNAFSGK